MSFEVTEIFTNMSDLLNQSFSKIQSHIYENQKSSIQEKPDLLKQEKLHQEEYEESK
jgi:hypothetical protein